MDSKPKLLMILYRYVYMYMYICMYMYIYRYIYMFICIYVYMYANTYVYTYVCIYICVYVYIYVYVCMFSLICSKHSHNGASSVCPPRDAPGRRPCGPRWLLDFAGPWGRWGPVPLETQRSLVAAEKSPGQIHPVEQLYTSKRMGKPYVW